MNSKSRTTIFFCASLLLHTIGSLLVVSFLTPERQPPVADTVSFFLFEIQPLSARKHINNPKILSLRTGLSGSPTHPQFSEAIGSIQQAILPAHNHFPVVAVGQENGGSTERFRQGIGTGDRDDFLGHSLLTEPVGRSSLVPFQTRKESLTGVPVLPPKRTPMNRSIDPLEKDILLSQPRVNPTDRADSNKIDVLFIISTRLAMQKYFGYAISLVEREIQHDKESEKDYRVGIVKSRFFRPERIHQIEYLPLSSDLDLVLQTAREIQTLRHFPDDILLNTIRYALDRCVFRPNAVHRIVVVGNDLPMCGGYSALRIIQLCLKKQVRLDIHGADQQIGPLLAHETGGRWYPALENPQDLKGLKSVHLGSGHWKIEMTLDTVVEAKLSDWRPNR